MSHIIDYLKKANAPGFEPGKLLQQLISEYNKRRDTYLFIYSVATDKANLAIQLDQHDYYAIHDVLKNKDTNRKIDFMIETFGGSPEAVEEIVKLLRSHFDEVNFVVSGVAKSAGTLLVLSGDEIFMTETGSLGPIDIQMRIGRSMGSVYSYMDWVNKRRAEAEEGKLNPFDTIMITQISPSEIGKVNDALNFTKLLVSEWLPKYKFKNWKGPEERKKRAEEIVDRLVNHSEWKTHGRSLKINDLTEIGLRIKNLDVESPELAEIVYKINTLVRLLFSGSDAYKVFATVDDLLIKRTQSRTTPTQ